MGSSTWKLTANEGRLLGQDWGCYDGHSCSAQAQKRQAGVPAEGQRVLPGKERRRSPGLDRQALMKDLLHAPGQAELPLPGFLPSFATNLHAHLAMNPSILGSSDCQHQCRNGVWFCSESIFLHSVSTLGHCYLMLMFSPHSGIWLFYEIAHSHLFNLKSIRQGLHFM